MSRRYFPLRVALRKQPLKKHKKSKPEGHNKFMRSVAEEIIALEFRNSDTIGTIKRRFYSIMRKYGIKEGVRTGKNTRVVANFEWSMAKHLFVSKVTDHFELIGILESIPKDLEAY